MVNRLILITPMQLLQQSRHIITKTIMPLSIQTLIKLISIRVQLSFQSKNMITSMNVQLER